MGWRGKMLSYLKHLKERRLVPTIIIVQQRQRFSFRLSRNSVTSARVAAATPRNPFTWAMRSHTERMSSQEKSKSDTQAWPSNKILLVGGAGMLRGIDRKFVSRSAPGDKQISRQLCPGTQWHPTKTIFLWITESAPRDHLVLSEAQRTWQQMSLSSWALDSNHDYHTN